MPRSLRHATAQFRQPSSRRGLPPLQRPFLLIAALAASAVVATSLPATAAPTAGRGAPLRHDRLLAGRGARHQSALRPACPAVPPRYARCLTQYTPQTAVDQATAAGNHGAAARPRGWGAPAIRAAYHLTGASSARQTVAVSIAFDTPSLAQYLAVYRKHYGLPPCTIASGCLRIVNQHGRPSPLPSSGVLSGWDLEATLDVSMVSAACPYCRILVIEGNSNADADLAATENTAARLGAQVISNSYGGQENGFAQAYARSYHHRGHTIVVSSGDAGFSAASFPANLDTVTAVGGTQLARARNARGWTETVWPGSGSGCSAYVPKPSWQHDRHCPGRTVADVAALASNVAIYNKDWGGWVTVAGTSIAAPLIAGVYGLAGNAATIAPDYAYHHSLHLFDIRTGRNAWSPTRACGRDYLCTAKRGYDAPTGLGTPNGTGAF
jgi:hypothetical protein